MTIECAWGGCGGSADVSLAVLTKGKGGKRRSWALCEYHAAVAVPCWQRTADVEAITLQAVRS